MVKPLFERAKRVKSRKRTAYRLLNSRFPVVALFDDVVDPDEFQVMYELQAMTNPRIQNAIGDLSLLPKEQWPTGIAGFNYAVGSFTHVNPNGSRFADGSFGVLYLGETMDTAIAEVKHHQDTYWRNVPELKRDQLQYRGLKCHFNERGVLDIQPHSSHGVYDPNSYGESQPFGRQVYTAPEPGIRYNSVRHPGATCWALMTPKPVSAIVQTAHYEMEWTGEVTSVKQMIWPTNSP